MLILLDSFIFFYQYKASFNKIMIIMINIDHLSIIVIINCDVDFY